MYKCQRCGLLFGSRTKRNTHVNGQCKIGVPDLSFLKDSVIITRRKQNQAK
ncbi:hypothetical protein H4R18_005513 [Coemansia javaensis]|uniref:C2H2-type domain-containing protein n=1 Tax=Coemansia javaensis TaxID=2761396 RepID=A0A9W8H1N0_9FUNG|nr:hypothetical protein H4R18_005513 [Coemansia javaensis]